MRYRRRGPDPQGASFPPGDERGLAVVDIRRLEDGRIVEHWDVVQRVPEAALVPNGMF
ncbi:hypothetical protein [Actinomadura sp. SCN-SB]|uniref:nuclear transport factor 2 family protein n=1 Tax=Actinomadura sp. SCN-SB TaxID=3373092 RepID=UPI003751160E